MKEEAITTDTNEIQKNHRWWCKRIKDKKTIQIHPVHTCSDRIKTNLISDTKNPT